MKITKNAGRLYSVKTKSPKPAKPKTVKVAINECHGGFSLSPKAVHWLACRQGKPCYFFTSNIGQPADSRFTAVNGYPDGMFWVASTSKELTDDNYNDVVLDQRPENRSDPDLIAVIEELGEEANGMCAEIKIVKIPADVKWHIEEYDGAEWVAEDHRTWH
jgi:hypothetical protein